MKNIEFLRKLGRTFFPAFSTGIGFCFVQMIVSDRPIMSAGLMLVCMGMALLCANLEVWAKAELARIAGEETSRSKTRDVYDNAC